MIPQEYRNIETPRKKCSLPSTPDFEVEVSRRLEQRSTKTEPERTPTHGMTNAEKGEGECQNKMFALGFDGLCYGFVYQILRYYTAII